MPIQPVLVSQVQFLPGASLRVTDPVLYHQIQADYGLGLGGDSPAASNVIIGTSPESLANQYGIGFVFNPSTAAYQNLPACFSDTSSATINGVALTPTQQQNGIQTLATTFTDHNGQTFSTVTWAWQVEVVLYTLVSAGAFNQQVVTWTGDGTANRLIPTTFDLTAGVTAIWGCGGIDKNV